MDDIKKFYLATLQITGQAIRDENYELAIRELSEMLRNLKTEQIHRGKHI